MLCDICWGMLRGQTGRQWKGTYDLHYLHQSSWSDLRTSYRLRCGICRVLYEEASKPDALLRPDGKEPETDSEDDRSFRSNASLSIVHEIKDDDVFRLDFKLKYKGRVRGRTFVLKQTGDAIEPFRTPMSDSTASDEVFKLALSWITSCDSRCKCVKRQSSGWYPTRLIDLSALKSELYLNKKREMYTGEEVSDSLSDFEVRVVEREPGGDLETMGVFSNQQNNLYVTLSHCWGKNGLRYQLNEDTYDELRRGVKLEKLPLTFQHAIQFAAQLHCVGWIWIDSLCIVQRSEDDWLRESALMQKVYRESFLNISATAADNSEAGLYFGRDPRRMWEDEVSLNIDGLPGLKEPHGDPATTKVDYGVREITLSLPKPRGLRRCVVVDALHWDDTVDRAPVNTRAWVLQERLLAPRVLHFCRDQIAWECAGFAAAEGHPDGVPKFQLSSRDRITPEIPVKGLDPADHGLRLRRNRLRHRDEPDGHLVGTGLYAFELWARVVEMYSRMHLTKSEDKLVALSGIAVQMSEQVLGTPSEPAEYVAGLWRAYLESQLLWRVEPVFHKRSRVFEHRSKRPPYRAPSFSWASLDAEMGNGVVYGDVTDKDLFIELDQGSNAVVVATQTRNKWGLVQRGHIMLWAKLLKMSLSRAANGRFSWKLLDRDDNFPGLSNETHTNVYLDCPDDDDKTHPIFESDNIYCVPAARSPRSEVDASKYIVCLILQQAADDNQVRHLNEQERAATFRRIGLTKLSSWADRLAYRHLVCTPVDSDSTYPCSPVQGYAHGRQLIRII